MCTCITLSSGPCCSGCKVRTHVVNDRRSTASILVTLHVLPLWENARVLSFMHSRSHAQPPTQTHTTRWRDPLFFLPISHHLVEHHDIWTVWAAARLAHCLFIRLDPVLSAQTGDASSSIWTTDALTHPENLSSQPHTHLWASRRFTGFYSSYMASPDASFLLFLRSFPLVFRPSSSLLPSRAGHCRPVRSAPIAIWKPRPLPHPSAFHMRAESVWSSAGGRQEDFKGTGPLTRWAWDYWP